MAMMLVLGLSQAGAGGLQAQAGEDWIGAGLAHVFTGFGPRTPWCAAAVLDSGSDAGFTAYILSCVDERVAAATLCNSASALAYDLNPAAVDPVVLRSTTTGGLSWASGNYEIGLVRERESVTGLSVRHGRARNMRFYRVGGGQ